MALYDYSQTPGSNTTISGINIAEGCNPSTINNAIRQLMADAREVYASATVASATTADIGAATATYINISGTTTITGFGTVAAGTWRVCKFAGILTLTHHGTSLILPGAANITTAAGDALYAVSEGSGNWRVVAYQRASGAPVSLATAQVATTYIADAAVTTDKIAAAAVTLTKVGLMSAGTIISFATGGTATAVETGVTGTVLTSNGATLLPSFQAATDPGMTLLGSEQASASAALSFTGLISSTYDEYELHIEDLVQATTTAGQSIGIEVYVGGAWKTSGYISLFAWTAISAFGTTNVTAHIGLTDATYIRDSAISGIVRFTNPNSTAAVCRFVSQIGYEYTATSQGHVGQGVGWYDTAGAAVTDIRIKASSGNLTSGWARLYGVRKT